MAKYLVVGGGLAGLSTSVYLTESGHEVELIEGSPKLGGRSYSFFNNQFNAEIDNGQHIFMGSYQQTIDFLEIISADNLPEYQSHLRIKFLERGGVEHVLDSRSSFYPFNLLIALINYSALNNFEKLNVLKLFLKILLNQRKDLNDITVSEWLLENNQSTNLVKSLWEIIGIGALNTQLREASANLFKVIIKKMFIAGNKSSTIVLPNVPLSKLFIEPCMNYFDKKRIKYWLSERLISLNSSGNLVRNITTTRGERSDFDGLVLAIPPSAISKINSENEILHQDILNMETSPIVSVHFKTSNLITEEKFIGLINSKIHWIFNNGTHYSLVISAADDLLSLNNSEIINIVKQEIEEFFQVNKPLKIESVKVIKEKKATLKSTLENESLRSKIKSNFKNLEFAGDWTNTQLPCTIEGAILSGKLCSDKF